MEGEDREVEEGLRRLCCVVALLRMTMPLPLPLPLLLLVRGRARA